MVPSKHRWIYTSPLAVAVLATTITGCSTVSSIDLSATHEKDRAGAYLNYSVAQSIFVIQVTAASATAQAPATSAPPAPASTTPSPAAGAPMAGAAAVAATPAAAQPVATTSTSTSTTTATPLIDTSICAVMNAEYTAGQTQVAGAISTYGLLLGRIAGMSEGKPAPQDTPKQLAGDLRNYVNLVTDQNYLNALASNNSTVYDQIVAQCAPKVAVSIQQLVVPDTTRTFAVRVRTNILYTDALTLGTDANGFLTNGAPTSTAALPSIATSIATDIGMAITPTGLVDHAADLGDNAFIQGILRGKPTKPVPALKPSCVSAPVSDLRKQIDDLETCPDVVRANNLLMQIANNLSKPGAMKNLPVATLPLTVYLPLEDLLANSPTSTDSLLKYINAALKVTVDFKCSARDPDPPTANEQPENAPARNDYGQLRATGVYDGLVVSAPRACEFRATQKNEGMGVELPLALNHFWAQDSRYLMLLPTSRGFLVARSVTYTFANGQATGVTDSRPSEALALFSTLGSIPGAFFGGVTTAATNNQAFTNASTANITAQTNNLTAQDNLLTAQTTLKNAKAAGAGTPKSQ